MPYGEEHPLALSAFRHWRWSAALGRIVASSASTLAGQLRQGTPKSRTAEDRGGRSENLYFT